MGRATPDNTGLTSECLPGLLKLPPCLAQPVDPRDYTHLRPMDIWRGTYLDIPGKKGGPLCMIREGRKADGAEGHLWPEPLLRCWPW